MSKHTPGPWTAQKVDSQEWEINAPEGDPLLGYSSWRCFAKVYGRDDDRAKGRVRAEQNARLIAAAPDMLDMLKVCHSALEYVGPWETPIGLIERVEELIQKVEK